MDITKEQLKDLIKHVIKEAKTFNWSTAHLGKVPEEVVNAGHKIVAVAQRDDPETHPEYWMSITQRPFLGATQAMDKREVNPDVWYIDKPGNHNRTGYWIISFNNKTKKWQLVSIRNGYIAKRSPEFDNIDAVIERWVGNLQESKKYRPKVQKNKPTKNKLQKNKMRKPKRIRENDKEI